MKSPATIRALMVEDSLGDALIVMQLLSRAEGDEHALSRIFDPFYTTKISGRGLGLAAALSAVRRHGGWIGAGNGTNGRGARFQVLLPIAA